MAFCSDILWKIALSVSLSSNHDLLTSVSMQRRRCVSTHGWKSCYLTKLTVQPNRCIIRTRSLTQGWCLFYLMAMVCLGAKKGYHTSDLTSWFSGPLNMCISVSPAVTTSLKLLILVLSDFYKYIKTSVDPKSIIGRAIINLQFKVSCQQFYRHLLHCPGGGFCGHRQVFGCNT